MGVNATISWDKVSNQPDIPDEATITSISNNCISTATVNADQINTEGLSAEAIYDPDNLYNVIRFMTAVGGFEFQVSGTGAHNYFSVLGSDGGPHFLLWG